MTKIMPTVSSDKASLSYMDRAGDGMPILFLHGSGFSKGVFSQQFESEELAGHRLIAVDLPGHGASPDADDPRATYSYEGFAAAVTAFVREIGLDRCVVVGWSLGGHIAYEMLGDVSQVAGVLAFGAPPVSGGPLGLIRSLHISRNLLLVSKGTFTEADAMRFENACLGGLRAGEFVETLQRTDERMRPSLSRNVMGNPDNDQRTGVETSGTPVCLLHGRRDPIVRMSYMQSLSGPGLFEGHTIIFNESGHAPFLDAQERFNRLLRRFADAVERDSGSDLRDIKHLYRLVG